MTLVLGMLLVGLVVAVVAAFVVREAGRIAREPPPALFDVDDAFEWVVEHVPDEIAATLTEADVRRILDLELQFLERKGVARNGSKGVTTPEHVVFGGAESVEFIVGESAKAGEAYLPEQVHGVLETQLTYLRAIGAIGPPAPPTAPGDDVQPA